MRVYALLLGTLLAVGQVYAAEVAVESATAPRVAGVPCDDAVVDPADQVWYGGVLDPVTIEARGVTPAAAITRRAARGDRRPTRLAHLPYRVIWSEMRVQ